MLMLISLAAAATLEPCDAADGVPAGFAGAAVPTALTPPSPITGYIGMHWGSGKPLTVYVYNSATPDRIVVQMSTSTQKKCASVHDPTGDLRLIEVRAGPAADAIHLEHPTTGAAIEPTSTSVVGTLHVGVFGRGGVDHIDTATTGGGPDVYQYLGGGGDGDFLTGSVNKNCIVGGTLEFPSDTPWGTIEENSTMMFWCTPIPETATQLDGSDTILVESDQWGIVFGSEDGDTITLSNARTDVWGDLGRNDMNPLQDCDTLALTPAEAADRKTWGDDIVGGPGDDFLSGQFGEDIIQGAEGDDYIDGYCDHDELYGGPDDDRIYGGDGGDDLYGEGGIDLMSGDLDVDHLDGGSEGDLLSGGLEDDELFGRDGADVLCGGGQNDTYDAGDGDDLLFHALAGAAPTADETPVYSLAGGSPGDECSDFSYLSGAGMVQFGEDPTGSCAATLTTDATDPTYLAECHSPLFGP